MLEQRMPAAKCIVFRTGLDEAKSMVTRIRLKIHNRAFHSTYSIVIGANTTILHGLKPYQCAGHGHMVTGFN